MIFLLFVSWSVFWVCPTDLESRTTISVVCLLALIAYNFVIDDEIPKLNYLTLIDKIILMSYLFAAIPTLESVFAKFLIDRKKENYALKTDVICRMIYLPAYALIFFGMLISSNLVTIPL